MHIVHHADVEHRHDVRVVQCAAARASASRRATASASSLALAMTLSATSRPRLRWRARNTTPMPPLPRALQQLVVAEAALRRIVQIECVERPKPRRRRRTAARPGRGAADRRRRCSCHVPRVSASRSAARSAWTWARSRHSSASAARIDSCRRWRSRRNCTARVFCGIARRTASAASSPCAGASASQGFELREQRLAAVARIAFAQHGQCGARQAQRELQVELRLRRIVVCPRFVSVAWFGRVDQDFAALLRRVLAIEPEALEQRQQEAAGNCRRPHRRATTSRPASSAAGIPVRDLPHRAPSALRRK